MADVKDLYERGKMAVSNDVAAVRKVDKQLPVFRIEVLGRPSGVGEFGKQVRRVDNRVDRPLRRPRVLVPQKLLEPIKIAQGFP